MLFFTAPPVAAEGTTGAATGHSVRYLAAKARRAEEIAKKRQVRDLEKQLEERVTKKARIDSDKQTDHDIEVLKKKTMSVLEKQLATSIDAELSDEELANLTAAQKAMVERMRAMEVNERKRADIRKVRLGDNLFADDWDSRVT